MVFGDDCAGSCPGNIDRAVTIAIEMNIENSKEGRVDERQMEYEIRMKFLIIVIELRYVPDY